MFQKMGAWQKEWRKHRMGVVKLKETMGTVAAMFDKVWGNMIIFATKIWFHA